MRRRDLLAVAAVAGLSRPAAAASPARVLLVATSAATAGPGGERTGIDLAGFAEAYWLLREADLAVEIATVRGGPPPLDPRTGSLAVLPVALRMDVEALQAFRATRALVTVTPRDGGHAGLLLSDGYGDLHDFPTSGPLGALIAATLAAGRPVAAIGHGTAGLLAPGPDGRAVAAGRRVTGPTDAEERAAGRAGGVPFSLEGRLRESGALFEAKGVLLENVVRDGPLITGQNAESAAQAVRLFVEALRGGPA